MDNRFYRTKEGADYVAAIEALALELAGALGWMVENDDTNEGDEPLSDYGGHSWNEINAYWIAGLNRSRAALSSPLLADLRAKEAAKCCGSCADSPDDEDHDPCGECRSNPDSAKEAGR